MSINKPLDPNYAAALAAHYAQSKLAANQVAPAVLGCPGGKGATAHVVMPVSYRDGPQNGEPVRAKKSPEMAAFKAKVGGLELLEPFTTPVGNLTCEQARAMGSAWATVLKPHLQPRVPKPGNPTRDGGQYANNLFFTNGIMTTRASAVGMAETLRSFFGTSELTVLYNKLEIYEPLVQMMIDGDLKYDLSGKVWKKLIADAGSAAASTASTAATAAEALAADVGTVMSDLAGDGAELFGGEVREVAYDYAWLQSGSVSVQSPYLYRMPFGEAPAGAQETLLWIAALYCAWQAGPADLAQPQTKIGIIGTSHGSLITAKGILAFANTFPEAIPWMRANIRLLHAGCCINRNLIPLVRSLVEVYEPHVDPRDPIAVMLGNHDRTELAAFYSTSVLAKLAPDPSTTVTGSVLAAKMPPTSGDFAETLDWFGDIVGTVLARVTVVEQLTPALSGYHSIMKSYARNDLRHFRRDFFGVVPATKFWPAIGDIALVGRCDVVDIPDVTVAAGDTVGSLTTQLTTSVGLANGAPVDPIEFVLQNPSAVAGLSAGQDLLGPSAAVAGLGLAAGGSVSYRSRALRLRCDARASAAGDASAPLSPLEQFPFPVLPVPQVADVVRFVGGPLDVDGSARWSGGLGFAVACEVVTDDLHLTVRAQARAADEYVAGVERATTVSRIAGAAHVDKLSSRAANVVFHCLDEQQWSGQAGTEPTADLHRKLIGCVFFSDDYLRSVEPDNATAGASSFVDASASGYRMALGSSFDATDTTTTLVIALSVDAGRDLTVEIGVPGLYLDLQATAKAHARVHVTLAGDLTGIALAPVHRARIGEYSTW